MSLNVVTHLNFRGQAREALTFYYFGRSEQPEQEKKPVDTDFFGSANGS